MTCDAVRDQLDDYLAGRLDSAAAQVVRDHLAGCAECRTDEAAARFLQPRLALLPRSVPPSRALWAGIERRLAPARAPRLSRWLALAAGLALLVGAAWWTVAALRVTLGPRAPLAAASPPRSEIWRSAAADLEAALLRQPRLTPLVDAAVRRDVRILDVTIAEVREALGAEPDNPLLGELYLGALRRKVELLRRAAALYAES